MLALTELELDTSGWDFGCIEDADADVDVDDVVAVVECW